MQRMLQRPRSLYNGTGAKGAEYSDTTTRFLDLPNTSRRSRYQRKILRVTRKYERAAKLYVDIPVFAFLRENSFYRKTSASGFFP